MSPEYLAYGCLLWGLYLMGKIHLHRPDPWKKQDIDLELFQSRKLAGAMASLGAIFVMLWPLLIPLFLLRDFFKQGRSS